MERNDIATHDLQALTAEAESALSSGDWGVAAAAYEALVRRQPELLEQKYRLARAYEELGRLEDVIELLSGASEAGFAKAKRTLAKTYVQLKNFAAAAPLLDELLAASPDDPKLCKWKALCAVQMETAAVDVVAQSGDSDRAISGYREIASRYPESGLAWLKLGTVLADTGRYDDAAAALREAASLHPEDAKIRKALTRVIVTASEERDVLAYVQDAIAAGMADFECYRWLARYHSNLHDWPAALQSARSALEIDPKHAGTRVLLIRILMHLDRLPEALDELNLLSLQREKAPETLQLKADIFVRLARLDDAIALYRAALQIAPKHPLISNRLSYALLLKGDIGGFHQFHERRRKLRTFIANNKEYPFRDWNGELSIEGKLLVWSEFGLGVGQNILHMTFLKPLAALGLDVVFEVEPRLVDICRRSFPDVTIVASDAELPEGISHHTPIGSLARWFKPDLESFASMRPYFLPDIEAVAAHRNRLKRAAGEGQLLIGISWTSNNPFVGDLKSIQLDQLLDAISLPDATLVNLQYGDHSESIARAEETTGKRLMDSGIDNSNDLDGLCAVVAAMDLVVSIGHTTAHVAGAIGIPNFVLLPAAPFPHWLDRGESCIWYPATKLFRQAPIDNGWAAVLARVGEAMCGFANDYDPERWLATSLVQALRPVGSRPVMSPQEIWDSVRAFVAQGAFRSALELFRRLPTDELSAEQQLHRAYLLGRLGDWIEARDLYESLRSADVDDREIESQILAVSLAMHDLEHALATARRLAVDDEAYRLTVANILYLLRRDEEALAELRAMSLELPQIEGLSILVGTLLLEMGEFERAESYLAPQAALGRQVEHYTLLGRSISAQGRHEEALAAYERGLAQTKRNDPAANFWRTQERIKQGLVPLVPLPPLLGEIPNVQHDDCVIFFVADNSYFWEHALVLLASIGRRSPSAKCHVHVINPDASVARAVEIVRTTLPDLRLSYSFEHAELEGCSNVHIRTYYASIRFVRLAEIFAQARATYLTLDADCIVRDDLAARVSGLDIADIGLRMRYDERPHLTVAAGALLLRPTPAAATFVDRVGTLIKDTLEMGEAVWFLDQIVLSHAVRELGGGEVDVSQLDMTYIDWFFHDDSLIWTGKGKRKSEDDRYTGELSQYRYLQENDEISRLMHQEGEESAEGDSSSTASQL